MKTVSWGYTLKLMNNPHGQMWCMDHDNLLLCCPHVVEAIIRRIRDYGYHPQEAATEVAATVIHVYSRYN